MDFLFPILSLFILIFCVPIIIIRAIKKKPIKKAVFGAVISAECFIIGASTSLDVFIGFTGLLILVVSFLTLITYILKRQGFSKKAGLGAMVGMGLFLLGNVINFVGNQGVVPQAVPDVLSEPTPSETTSAVEANLNPPFTLTLNALHYKGEEEGQVGFALTDVEIKDIVGANQNIQKPDGKFLVIHMGIQNKQKEAITIDTTRIMVKDNQGREYSSSFMGSVYYGVENKKEKNLYYYQINPEVTTAGYVVFDVSKEFDPSTGTVEIMGAFLDKEVTLPLVVQKQ